MKEKFRPKIIILGSKDSGKTVLIKKITEGKTYDIQKVEETFGVDPYFATIPSHTANNLTVEFQIWDTTGNKQFTHIVTSYIRGAAYVIVTCDLTRRKSFQEIDQWINLAKKEATNASILLVGTKSDLVAEITEEELDTKAQEHDCVAVFKTSSKNDENIDEVFQKCADIHLDKHPPKQTKKSVSKAFSAGAPSLAFSKNTNNRSQAIDYFTTQKHIKLVEHFEKLWTKELKHPHENAIDQDAEKIIQLLRNYAKFNKSFSLYKFTRNHVSEVETIIKSYYKNFKKGGNIQLANKVILKQQLDALVPQLKNSAGTLAALIHFVGEKLDKKTPSPLITVEAPRRVDVDKKNSLIKYYSGFHK